MPDEARKMMSDPLYNGFYTIQNQHTGEHRTFRIHTQSPDSSFAPGKRIIAMLIAGSHYRQFAFLDHDDTIRLWSKFSDSAKNKWWWYKTMLWHIAKGIPSREFDIGRYTIMLDKRCKVCNKQLTNPESLRTGIGPVCASRN